MSETTDKKLGFAHRLYTGQISYDFIRHRKLWFMISGVLLVLTILVLLIRGLTLGIEFRGGTDFQVPMQVTSTTVDDVRSQVNEFSVEELEPQVFSLGDKQIRIQTRTLSPEETTTTRAEIADLAGVTSDDVTYNAIGASWGKEISRQGVIALVVFTVLVMLLIAVYFRDWKMSIAAIVAVFHDLLLTVGVYAAVGFTVTPSTVIGVLTILGYSLYDTVVVFDKIRENTRNIEETNWTYSERANLATNQVIVRSLNTTIIGILPVLALFSAGTLLDSGPLADLGLALLVGMVAGAYSSLFIASPILAMLREREPAMVEHRERIERRKQRAEAKSAHRHHVAEENLVHSGAVAADDHAPISPVTPGERRVRRTGGTRADRKKGK
ncbi:protein translocase subunit SecF [Tessaracoccus sp. MC1865]|uniref:protein translocase subunit SecF n=1 Tax=Tessaracoccus sp. MC1865 TaxID=2760310 RepID=UPI001603CCFE|nr:protein translocase subunit SecF [Tessaracoccus sp. MC1865]MBB1484728.1 protein translocase subunit SecF [Tessaracoccus sp. MC1865]QTO36329.1 protein translocase subunit SecF [Tessaracoccus sp. MC1865]